MGWDGDGTMWDGWDVRAWNGHEDRMGQDRRDEQDKWDKTDGMGQDR